MSEIISSILGFVAKRGWKKFQLTEFAHKLGLTSKIPHDADFETVYVYSLLGYYGQVGEAWAVLADFFRHVTIQQAFESAFVSRDFDTLAVEIDTFLDADPIGHKIVEQEINAHEQMLQFWAVFNRTIDETRLPQDVRQDQKIDDIYNLAIDIRDQQKQSVAIKPQLSHDEILEALRVNNGILRNYEHQIAKRSIERPEIESIMEWLLTDKHKQSLAMLVDKPGSGKTVAMAQLLQRLESSRIPVLAIKADSLSNVDSNDDLLDFVGLANGNSIEDCLKLISRKDRVVVLIDQVDALSIALTQDFATLDLITTLITRLKSIEGIRLIVSCREFDRQFDPKLSSIDVKTKFHLKPLEDEIISEILYELGIDYTKLSENLRRLLTNPQNLSIYAELAVEKALDPLSDNIYSLHQLYDKLWDIRVSTSQVAGIRDVIDKLVDTIHNQRHLAVPKGIFDDDRYRSAAQYLQSVNFIREEKGSYLFSHQTLFDYCYARRFLADGKSISEEILKNSSQGLLQRSEMLQVIAFLREANFDRYIDELTTLLFSEHIRFHLWQLLVEWFASLPQNITADELIVARKLCHDADTCFRFLGASNGNIVWFDTLPDEFFISLLHNGDLSKVDHRTIRYLRSIITSRISRTLRLLNNFSHQEDWKPVILECLEGIKDWNNDDALELLCELIDDETMVSRLGLELCLRNLISSNPIGACRVLKIVFSRHLTNWLSLRETLAQEAVKESGDNRLLAIFSYSGKISKPYNDLIENYTINGALSNLSDLCPEEFIDSFLDWFTETSLAFIRNEGEERYPSDEIFDMEVYSYFNVDDGPPRGRGSFTKALVKALRNVAEYSLDKFTEYTTLLLPVESYSVQCVIALAYLSKPIQFAEQIYSFLNSDGRRYELGNSDFISCELVAAVINYGNPSSKQNIENNLLSWKPTKVELKYREIGYRQAQFFNTVEPELLSAKGRRRYQELKRRYPEMKHRPPPSPQVRAVMSPLDLSQLEKMSDKDLLNIMRKYDGSVERQDFLVGDIRELSPQISKLASVQPDRFYKLSNSFDNTIPVPYIRSILEGLAESTAPIKWITNIALQYHSRFAGENRMGFCRAIRKRVKDGIKQELVDVIVEWAINDSDPDKVRAAKAFDDKRNDWLTETVFDCFFSYEKPQYQKAFQFLSKIIDDPAAPVGACILQSFTPLLNTDNYREKVLDLAEILLDKHPELLDDQFSHYFLSWASFHYFSKFGKYIFKMLNSENEITRRFGATLACQAALENDDAHELQSQAIDGDKHMRQGAAYTYSMYLQRPYWRATCEHHLLTLMHDSDLEVRRNVTLSFSYMKPEDITENTPFILALIDSPTLPVAIRELADYIKPMSFIEYELSLEITEKIVEMLRTTQSREFGWEDVVSLPLAVYNRSRDLNIQHRAMNLFDDLVKLNIGAAKDALKQWDRDRRIDY